MPGSHGVESVCCRPYISDMATLEVLPPGSRWPRLLQTALFMTTRPRLLRHFKRRHGDVFTVRLLGSQTVVTVSDPVHIREVFAGTPAVFHAGEGNEILRPVMGPTSVMITDEQEHLRTRKLLMPAFNGAALRGYGTLMTELAEANVKQWPVDHPFPVHEAMNEVTLEIILRVVFGMTDGPRLTALRPRIRTLTDINPITALGWSYPWLSRLPPWRRGADNLREVDRLLYEEIAERRSANVESRTDVLSRLLNVAGTDLTDEELRDQMITLLLAGHETTATALAWTFHDLSRNRTVLAQAQEAAVDNDEDYLQAVAKEALRRHPIIQNVPRVLTEPTDIAGYHLPRGTIVAANTTLAHENPVQHESPEDFRPDRFLGKPLPLGTWIPFGGGVRRCLGAGFSLKEMAAVLGAALTRYDLHPAQEKPEFARPRNITLIPSRGARIVATPRP